MGAGKKSVAFIFLFSVVLGGGVINLENGWKDSPSTCPHLIQEEVENYKLWCVHIWQDEQPFHISGIYSIRFVMITNESLIVQFRIWMLG